MDDNNELHDVLANVSLKYNNEFKIAHINAQSLVDTAHFTEFHYLFNDTKFDVISVSESFLKPNIPDSSIYLPGYNSFRIDRTGRACGGVIVYVKDNISCIELCSSPSEYTKSPEYIMLELKLKDMKILLVSIYRPPKVGYMDKVLEDIHAYIFTYKYIFFVGDVNARFGSGTFETENLCDLFSSCNLTCIPFQNTYHTSTCDSNLDVIASNCHDLLIHHGQQPAPCFSNHDLLFGVYSLATPKYVPRQFVFRDFKHFNFDVFVEDAEKIQWQDMFRMNNINDKVTFFTHQILALYDKHAPLKSVTCNTRPVGWMSFQIRTSIKERDNARKKYMKKKNPEDYEVYRKIRNQTKQIIRNAKVKHIYGLFQNCKSSADCWRAAKSLGMESKKRQTNTTELPIPVSELSQHFSNTGVPFDNERIRSTVEHYQSLEAPSREKFYFLYASPETIVRALTSIRTKAMGPDKIPIYLITKCLPVLLPFIEHIYNFSLQNSIFPSQWKLANIKPIPKVSKPQSCQDVRGINLLCSLSKGLERIVYDQICTYLQEHAIINTYQSGFKKLHSTVTALLKITDDIRLAMDHRKLTLLCLFDFSRAFDCVHHDLLLAKLRYIGFSGNVISWCHSYLQDRYQRVMSNEGSWSEWVEVKNGVPQGSVLGPLLFLLYTFDVFTVFHQSKYHMFADDLQAYIHFPATELTSTLRKMNDEIGRLTHWACNHNLILNPSKTQIIFMGHSRILNSLDLNSAPPLLVNGIHIPHSSAVKNLGMLMDSTLSWTVHINSTVNKAVSIIHQLRRNISYMPCNIRKLLIQSLVFPVIEYCSVVYNDLGETLNIKIQRTQNACVRFILGVRKDEHITPYFIQLKWLKLKERRTLQIAKLTLSILKHESPMYLYELFSRMDSVHSRVNRFTQGTMQIPHHRTAKFNKSFICTASRVYNTFNLHNFEKVPQSVLKRHLTTRLMADYK